VYEERSYLDGVNNGAAARVDAEVVNRSLEVGDGGLERGGERRVPVRKETPWGEVMIRPATNRRGNII